MKKLLLTCLMLLTSPAWAEWVLITTSANGMGNYIDPETIRKNGDMRLVWELQNLEVRHKDGELSRRFRTEYDCRLDRHRFLSSSQHSEQMATGMVLYTQPAGPPGVWRDSAPGTISETILKYVCAK